MTIESTKRIIASIILAIMLLGLTTPTFAATTKGFDFGNAIGGLTKAATGVFDIVKTVTPEIGKIATDVISKVDTSKIKESIGGITSNIGKNDNKNDNNGFKESITGIVTNLGKSILSNTFSVLFKNEDKLAEEKEQFSITNIFGQKDDNEVEKVDTQKSTGILNIFKNMFNKEYIEETADELKDKLNINKQQEDNKSTGILNIFKNMFNKDETVEQDKETDQLEETVNKVKEETTTLFESIGQKGLFGGIMTYISNKKTENVVGVDGVTGNIEEEEEEDNVTILGFFNKLKENLGIKKDDEKTEEIVTTEPETTQEAEEEPEQTKIQTNTNKTNSSDYKFTGYYFANGGASKDDNGLLGSGVKHEELTVNEEGWYMYEGKVVLATSTKPLLNTGKYAERDNIEYFDYYDEVEFEYNGKTYTGIILDSCGAAMKTPIMDIRCAGGYYDHVNNTINQDVITVYY